MTTIQLKAKQQVAKPKITTGQLRRDILESTYRGQDQARLAQVELGRQGERLQTSLNQAKRVVEQTNTTTAAVDDLISEAKASKLRKVFRCCLDCCCCCCCSCKSRDNRKSASIRIDQQSRTISPASDNEDSENDNETLVRLESLKSNLSEVARGTTNWRRTLAPPPGALPNETAANLVWHRQVDASLNQLQHVAEDLGQSLEEQIKLAQMLTIYLSYGVDQVIGANERLGAEKALF